MGWFHSMVTRLGAVIKGSSCCMLEGNCTHSQKRTLVRNSLLLQYFVMHIDWNKCRLRVDIIYWRINVVSLNSNTFSIRKFAFGELFVCHTIWAINVILCCHHPTGWVGAEDTRVCECYNLTTRRCRSFKLMPWCVY